MTTVQNNNTKNGLGGVSTRSAGIALIIIGAVFLLSRVIPGFETWVWAAAFFGAAAVVYNVYKQNTARWGWLLAAYTLLVPGVLIVTAAAGFDRLFPAIMLTAFAVPFLYVYSLNREQWGWLVPAAVFLTPAAIIMLGLVWAFIPVALIIGGVYLLVRGSNKTTPAPDAASSNGHKQYEPEKSPVLGQRPISGPEADY